MAPKADQPGEHAGRVIADRFKLESLLYGDDPLGPVYLAHSTQGDGAPVAVQLLHQEIGTRRAQSGNLEADLEAAEDVQSPDLSAVEGFDLDDEPRWLAWSIPKDAFTLAQALEEGPLPPRGAALLILRLAEALGALHQERVFHRNLHPGAVLIAGVTPEELRQDPEAPARAQVKLTRWAHAHLVSVKDPQAAHQKDPEAFLGYPEYFAPEQAQGRPVDERSDLYALGTLFYQCLTGKPPFTSSNFGTTLKRHIYEKPLAPRLARSDKALPEGLEDIVLQLMAKKPHERFDGTRALIGALRGVGFALRAEQPSQESPVEDAAQAQAEEAKAEEPQDSPQESQDQEPPRKTMLLSAVSVPTDTTAKEPEATPDDSAQAEEAKAEEAKADDAQADEAQAEEAKEPEAPAEAPEATQEANDAKAEATQAQEAQEPEAKEGEQEPEQASKTEEEPQPGPQTRALKTLESGWDNVDLSSVDEGAKAEEAKTEKVEEPKAEEPATVIVASQEEDGEGEDGDSDGDDEDEEDTSSGGKRGKRGKRNRKKGKNKKTETTPKVTEMKGRQKSDLPAPNAEESAEKTRKVTSDKKEEQDKKGDEADKKEATEPDFEIGSVEVAAAPNPDLGMDQWFSSNVDDIDDEPPANETDTTRYNTIVLVVIAALVVLGVGGIYVWSTQVSQEQDKAAEQEKIEAQERKRTQQIKDLVQRFEEQLQKGEDDQALYTLRRLKTDANASNTPEYQQAEQLFLKEISGKMQKIEADGSQLEARTLAQLLIQLKPDHAEATAVLKRPIAPPPAEVDAGAEADAAQADAGEADAAQADATGADAAEPAPAEEEPAVPEEAAPPAEEPEEAAAPEDKEPAAAQVEEEKPAQEDKQPPAEVAKVEDGNKPDPAAERAKRREEAQEVLREASSKNGAAALGLYRKAARLDPSSHRAHYQIGVILSQQGDFGGAVPSLERAVRLRGSNAQYRLRLANAYLKTNARDKARTQYQKVLELDPENRAAKTMIKRL